MTKVEPPAEYLAGQGEPVAWAHEYRNNASGGWELEVSRLRPFACNDRRNIRPLYAAPAPSRPADRGPVPMPDLTPVEIAFDTAVEAYWRDHVEGTAVDARRAGLKAAIDLALCDAPRDGGDGWRLVPAEPTQAMWAAFRNADSGGITFHAGYRAMIAASPSRNTEDVAQDSGQEVSR